MVVSGGFRFVLSPYKISPSAAFPRLVTLLSFTNENVPCSPFRSSEENKPQKVVWLKTDWRLLYLQKYTQNIYIDLLIPIWSRSHDLKSRFGYFPAGCWSRHYRAISHLGSNVLNWNIGLSGYIVVTLCLLKIRKVI